MKLDRKFKVASYLEALDLLGYSTKFVETGVVNYSKIHIPVYASKQFAIDKYHHYL